MRRTNTEDKMTALVILIDAARNWHQTRPSDTPHVLIDHELSRLSDELLARHNRLACELADARKYEQEHPVQDWQTVGD
jgi:hypothetical protein